MVRVFLLKKVFCVSRRKQYQTLHNCIYFSWVDRLLRKIMMWLIRTYVRESLETIHISKTHEQKRKLFFLSRLITIFMAKHVPKTERHTYMCPKVAEFFDNSILMNQTNKNYLKKIFMKSNFSLPNIIFMYKKQQHTCWAGSNFIFSNETMEFALLHLKIKVSFVSFSYWKSLIFE